MAEKKTKRIRRTKTLDELLEMAGDEAAKLADSPGEAPEVRMFMKIKTINEVDQIYDDPTEEDLERSVEIAPDTRKDKTVEEFTFEQDGSVHVLFDSKARGNWSRVPS